MGGRGRHLKFTLMWQGEKNFESLEQAETFHLSALELDPEHKYAKKQLANLRGLLGRFAHGEEI